MVTNLATTPSNENMFEILSKLNGQALHAKSLGFIHPKTNKWVNFESNLPNDFSKLLKLLNNLST